MDGRLPRCTRYPLSLALVTATGIALAQPDTTAPLPDPTERREAALQLPTLVITARRSEEKSQDVPGSVAVIAGDELERGGFHSVQDLPQQVAGMVVAQPNPRLTNISIRGLGAIPFNDGLESSTGVVVDGVYVGPQSFAALDQMDIERVEVLRGPQGTLFGKNTTGGIVQLITRTPTPAFEAAFKPSVGSLDARSWQGLLNTPIIAGELAGRVTAFSDHHDGWLRNIFNGDDLNAKDRHGLRGQLLWTPNPDWKGRFIADWNHQDESCCVYPLITPIKPLIANRDGYMEYTRPSLNPFDRVVDEDENAQFRNRLDQHRLSAEITRQLGERHQLVSVSALNRWDFTPSAGDYTSLLIVRNSGVSDAHDILSQELRLHSHFDQFDTIAGLYYYQQETRGNDFLVAGPDLVRWVLGGLVRERVPTATYSNSGAALDAAVPPETYDGFTQNTPFEQRSRSIAAFGSADWHATRQLTLTAGLRYTRDRKHATVQRSLTGGQPQQSPANFLDVLRTVTATANQSPAPTTPVPNVSVTEIIFGHEFQADDRYDDDHWTGQLAARYALNDDTNLYALAAQGYKAGGINLGVTDPGTPRTFGPELALSYELGVKGNTAGERIGYSLATYRTDIDGFQALTFHSTSGLVPSHRLNQILNVSQVALRGAELELSGYVLPRLLGRFGLAYSKATTVDFTNAPDEKTQKNTKDLSGQQLFNAPLWTGTVGLNWSQPLTAIYQLNVDTTVSYASEYNGVVEKADNTIVAAHSVTNLGIGLANHPQQWELRLWSRNLWDENYLNSFFPLYGIGHYGALASTPRMVGLSFQLRWN